jgi:hypothetical protein
MLEIILKYVDLSSFFYTMIAIVVEEFTIQHVYAILNSFFT